MTSAQVTSAAGDVRDAAGKTVREMLGSSSPPSRSKRGAPVNELFFCDRKLRPRVKTVLDPKY